MVLWYRQLLAKANAVHLKSDPLPKAELQQCLISESHCTVLKDAWKWVLSWKMSWNNMSYSVFQIIFLGCCFSLLAACFLLSKFILYILYLFYYSLTLKSNFHREILFLIKILLPKWKHLQETFNFDYFLRSKIILKSLYIVGTLKTKISAVTPPSVLSFNNILSDTNSDIIQKLKHSETSALLGVICNWWHPCTAWLKDW